MEVVFLIVLCFFAILVVFFFWLWVGERTRVHELKQRNEELLLCPTMPKMNEVEAISRALGRTRLRIDDMANETRSLRFALQQVRKRYKAVFPEEGVLELNESPLRSPCLRGVELENGGKV